VGAYLQVRAHRPFVIPGSERRSSISNGSCIRLSIVRSLFLLHHLSRLHTTASMFLSVSAYLHLRAHRPVSLWFLRPTNSLFLLDYGREDQAIDSHEMEKAGLAARLADRSPLRESSITGTACGRSISRPIRQCAFRGRNPSVKFRNPPLTNPWRPLSLVAARRVHRPNSVRPWLSRCPAWRPLLDW
jgi:hypothetical protein